MNVNLRALIDRLNKHTRGAVEGAAGLCLSRTHYDVEIEHFLLKLLDQPDADLAPILRHYEIDRSRLSEQLTAALDGLKTGNARTPSLSPSLVKMLQEAWVVGSLDFGASRIRSGFTILALARDEELRRMITDTSPELGRISAEDLAESFEELVAESAESAGPSGGAGRTASTGESAGAPASGPTPNLDQFTIDLTARARAGDVDPVLGRDFEIRQVVDILTRRRQNNPILVGEAGVGKTAVVEGFAVRVAEGDLPEVLRNVSLRTLDLALLQAGAGVKGEFENRLKGLIEEVKSSPKPIILFIDEAHTLIGAGGQAGSGDAANLLKPALARGELRTIAATTWSEYKKYIEKDPALTRRFQTVKVEEPTREKCMVMMRGVVPYLESHHGVRILEDGMAAAVELSARYLPDRQLPDKSVSVLDTACARISLGQSATPAPIEGARRRLQDIDVQTRILEREAATGADHADRLADLADERERVEAKLEELEERWNRERDLVKRLRATRARIEELTLGGNGAGEDDAAPASEGDEESARPDEESAEAEGARDDLDLPDSTDELRALLGELTDELEASQSDTPLVPAFVDQEVVGQVISGWTGIPVGKMLRDEVETVLSLEDHLGQRVVGQDHALEIISHRIRTSRAGIEDPQKPIGVFLLVGPSGVGKTETALTLSDLLYGGEDNLVSINMSEFQEAHTVSSLRGSPPGYVGYGEGGVLTEAVRRRPYSVVLLDEVEKAHPDVLELFFQVFDKGIMEDGEGRRVDFKNTVIVLTSNAATDTIMSLCADPETMPDHQGLVKALKPELNEIFKPAFLGRTVIVPYFPLGDSVIKEIIGLKVEKVRNRLQNAHEIDLALDPDVIEEIAERCTEVESGARNIDNILTNTVLPSVSRLLLRSMVDEERPERIRIGLADDGDFEYLAEG